MGGAAAPPDLVERLRGVHLAMVDAVLGGDGLSRVAELAAGAAGGPVAIVIPRLGAAGVAPEAAAPGGARRALRKHGADRRRARPAPLPATVLAEAPIRSGDELIGIVALLRADVEPG